MLNLKQCVHNFLKTLFWGLLLVFLFIGEVQGNEPQVQLTLEERAWLAENPVITLTTLPNWQPFVITDDKTGELTGIDVEFIKLLNQRLGGAIKIETYDWKTLVQMSKDHKVDGFFPASITEDRKPYLVWTRVYNSTPLALVTLRDAPDIKEWRDLAGKKVVMTASSSYIELLGELAPEAEIVIVKNVEEQVPFLAEGKADAALNSAPVLYHTMRSNNVLTLMRFQKYYISDNHGQFRIAIRNDKPLLLSILNKGIGSITEEEFNAIKNKWIPIEVLSGSPLKATFKLTPEERAWLVKHPKINVGIMNNWPPMNYVDEKGIPRGIGVDYLEAINTRLGNVLNIIPATFKENYDAVQAKRLDALMDITPKPDREPFFNFTKPYLTIPQIIVGQKDTPYLNDEKDLYGKTVALEHGYYTIKRFKRDHPEIKIREYNSTSDCLDAVARGEVDAYVGNRAVAIYLIEKELIANLQTMGRTSDEKPVPLAIGTRKDFPELAVILDKALASLSPQTIQDIHRKWTKSTDPMAKAIVLTPEEQAWLAQNHTVRVRVVDYPPYQIIKSNEAPQGIVIEHLKLIEERTGIRFEYEVTDQPFAEFLESIKQRQGPDMTAIIAPSPEREKYLSFTEPYLSSPYVIFIRQEDNPIFDIQGLVGKTLAVLRGVVVQEQLSKEYPEIRLALFDTDEKALQALATGQADAYIGDLTVASHIIHKQGLTALKVTAPGPFKDLPVSMGTRSDWPELNSIISKALESITEEEKTAIRNKYLAIKFEQGINKAKMLKWVLSFGGVGLGIVIIILFWNRRLSREIIKRKQTEEDLKQASDEADAANQAKSLFLANMSHELRTPLNAILGFSGILGRERDATTDQKEKLTIINRSGLHLLSMINDVLDLSKIEAGRIELQENPFDLVALIDEISVMIRSHTTEKGLSVAVEAETVSFPYIKADGGKLRQILINLLGNAAKFTDEGGVIIRCATDPIPEEPNRCHIVIEVEDTGPGIDPARQAKIFDPFVQGIDMPVRKGTGLGLSICKAYADLMGGTLEVESELGKGSLFRVQLPAEIAEAADIKSPVDDKPRVIGLAPTDKTWRILITDDNRENLLLLKSLLESVGFVVIEAKNGKEAVEAFKKESLDLIWMDMRMPVMDGYEAARQIRQCSGGDTVPIIAITASAFSEQRHEILAAGCDDMVIKPFQAHEIFEMMGRFLDIEYIYESEQEAAPVRVPEVELTAAMLADLPEELLQRLRETTLELNMEVILEVIDRIEAHAPETAEHLRALVQTFQIQRIREVLKKVEDK